MTSTSIAAPRGSQSLDLLPAQDPLAGTAGFLWTYRFCVYGLLLVAVFLGGPVIRIGALAAGIVAALADRAGAIRHLLHLAWLPLAIWLASHRGPAFGNWISRTFDAPAVLSAIIGVGIIVIGGLVVTSLVGAYITTRLHRSRYLYVLNRCTGNALGVAEGAALAVVLAWTLSIFGPALSLHAEALAGTYPQLARPLKALSALQSAVCQDPATLWLEQRNPLTRSATIMTVAAVSEVAADPALFWEVVEEGGFDQLLAIPVVRRHYDAIKADTTLRKAIDNRDIQKIASSTVLLDALNDDELCKAIAESWPDIRARLSTGAVERAQRMAGKLEGVARLRYQQAVERAEEFGVKLN